jgi:hypothetical protein
VAKAAIAILTALSLTACGGPDRPVETPPSIQPLLSAAANWDGHPGVESISLYDDGRLQAGSDVGRADLTEPSEYFREQASLDVVELGHPDHHRAVLLSLPRSNEDEDPPNLYQLFVEDEGRLRRVFNRELGNYGVVELRFDGDGTARYREDDWSACGRIGREMSPVVVDLQEVTLGLVDGTMQEIDRRPSGQTKDCDRLAG